MVSSLKPFLSCEAQLDLLKRRGVAVDDEGTAIATLKRVGYYRLAGYFYPFRNLNAQGERLDSFVPGTSFEQVAKLAEFDKGLRMLVLDAVESIETATRAAVATRLGRRDPEAHLSRNTLGKRFQGSSFDEWQERFARLCSQSKEEFVRHHRVHYDGRMPIWVAVEIWEFGLLSKFVSSLRFKDQSAIAAEVGGVDGDIFASWLQAIAFIRNVAAHHGRLWNRPIQAVPRLPRRDQLRALSPLHDHPRSLERLFGVLTLLQFLLRRIEPQTRWPFWLGAHLTNFPTFAHISLRVAGFPDGWEQFMLWQPSLLASAQRAGLNR